MGASGTISRVGDGFDPFPALVGREEVPGWCVVAVGAGVTRRCSLRSGAELRLHGAAAEPFPARKVVGVGAGEAGGGQS